MNDSVDKSHPAVQALFRSVPPFQAAMQIYPEQAKAYGDALPEIRDREHSKELMRYVHARRIFKNNPIKQEHTFEVHSARMYPLSEKELLDIIVRAYNAGRHEFPDLIVDIHR